MFKINIVPSEPGSVLFREFESSYHAKTFCSMMIAIFQAQKAELESVERLALNTEWDHSKTDRQNLYNLRCASERNTPMGVLSKSRLNEALELAKKLYDFNYDPGRHFTLQVEEYEVKSNCSRAEARYIGQLAKSKVDYERQLANDVAAGKSFTDLTNPDVILNLNRDI